MSISRYYINLFVQMDSSQFQLLELHVKELEKQLFWTRKVLGSVCYWIQQTFGQEYDLPKEILKHEYSEVESADRDSTKSCSSVYKVDSLGILVEDDLEFHGQDNDISGDEDDMDKDPLYIPALSPKDPVRSEVKPKRGSGKPKKHSSGNSTFHQVRSELKAKLKRGRPRKQYLESLSVNRRLECSICTQRFQNQETLSRHEMVHCSVKLIRVDEKCFSNFPENESEDLHKDNYSPSETETDSDSGSDSNNSIVSKRKNSRPRNDRKELRLNLCNPNTVYGAFYCPICPESVAGPYKSMDILIMHKIENHPEESANEIESNRFTRKQFIFRCPVCQTVYGRKIVAEKHINQNHGKSSEPVILEEIVDMNTFEVPIPEDNSELSCHLCLAKEDKELFANPAELKVHVLTRHRSYPKAKYSIHENKCQVCGIKCQTSFKFILHLKAIHPEAFEDIMQSRPDLKRESDKIFSETYCRTCKLMFNSVEELGNHNAEFHNFKCPKCPKICKNITQLSWHERNVHGDLKLPCPTCGKTFKNKDYLKLHLYCHGEPQFPCNLCEYKARFPSALRSHLAHIHHLTNQANKPAQCHLCGEIFSSRNTQLSHTRTVHTQVRKYECKLCDKKFKVGNALKNHLRTHTNPNTKNRGLNKERVYRRRMPNKPKPQVQQSTSTAATTSTTTTGTIVPIPSPTEDKSLELGFQTQNIAEAAYSKISGL